MTKIVINNCYGGFSLSTEAVELARQLSNNPKWGDVVLDLETYPDGTVANPAGNRLLSSSHYPNVKRNDPFLVQVVEQLGDKANGACAELKVVEVDGKYRINEYDGYESVETPEDIHWEE